MTPEISQIDDLEQRAYIEGFERHIETVGGANRMHDFLQNYNRVVRGEEDNGEVLPVNLGIESLRVYARTEVMGPKKGERYYPQGENSAAEFLEICRDVTTQMAITYFRHLQAYLEARETGVEEIDDIREQVAVSSALLLRQTEDIIETLKPPRSHRDLWDTDKYLKKLIDIDRVSREAKFRRILSSTGLNHFAVLGEDKRPRLITHTTNTGLDIAEILQMVNSLEDLSLHNTESHFHEDNKIGTVNKDGTINLDLDEVSTY